MTLGILRKLVLNVVNDVNERDDESISINALVNVLLVAALNDGVHVVKCFLVMVVVMTVGEPVFVRDA